MDSEDITMFDLDNFDGDFPLFEDFSENYGSSPFDFGLSDGAAQQEDDLSGQSMEPIDPMVNGSRTRLNLGLADPYSPDLVPTQSPSLSLSRPVDTVPADVRLPRSIQGLHWRARDFLDTNVAKISTTRKHFSQDQTDALEAWFLSHLSDPYPNQKEKADLAHITALDIKQVERWFSRTRQRKLPLQPVDELQELPHFFHSKATITTKELIDFASPTIISIKSDDGGQRVGNSAAMCFSIEVVPSSLSNLSPHEEIEVPEMEVLHEIEETAAGTLSNNEDFMGWWLHGLPDDGANNWSHDWCDADRLFRLQDSHCRSCQFTDPDLAHLARSLQWQGFRRLQACEFGDKTLIHLLSLYSLRSLEEAQLLETALRALDGDTKATLVQILNFENGVRAAEKSQLIQATAAALKGSLQELGRNPHRAETVDDVRSILQHCLDRMGHSSGTGTPQTHTVQSLVHLPKAGQRPPTLGSGDSLAKSGISDRGDSRSVISGASAGSSRWSLTSYNSWGRRQGRRRPSSQDFPKPHAAVETEMVGDGKANRYPCRHCQRTFNRKSTRARHEESRHTLKRVWVCKALDAAEALCPICNGLASFCPHKMYECWKRSRQDRTFSRRDGLRQHLIGRHKAGDRAAQIKFDLFMETPGQ